MGSIAKIHEMLVSKQCSCTELTKSYLEEIEKSNGELNAYVTVTPETALETAKVVDEKIARGEEIGMLEGVPMTLKDNISTKDIETTCCSKILKGTSRFITQPCGRIFLCKTPLCSAKQIWMSLQWVLPAKPPVLAEQ